MDRVYARPRETDAVARSGIEEGRECLHRALDPVIVDIQVGHQARGPAINGIDQNALLRQRCPASRTPTPDFPPK